MAGVSHREQAVIMYIGGNAKRIELAEEPSDKYPHAIAVYGKWIDQRNEIQKKQLGYLPDQDAKAIARKTKKQKDYLLVAKLAKMFIPVEDKGPGLRIHVGILAPAIPRFIVHGFGRDTGRKRRKTYIAKDKEEAILKASQDGIIVDVEKTEKV